MVKEFDIDNFDPGDGVPYIPMSKQEELVIRRYLDDGLSPKDISERHKINIEVVYSVIRRAQLRKKADGIKEEVKDELFKDRVPVLRAIGDTGLVALLEWFQLFTSTGAHLKMEVEEAAKLEKIIEGLNNMVRLDLGKSTANVAMMVEHSTKTMEQVLKDLNKPAAEGGDPFVDYPAIEDKSSERVKVEVLEKDEVKAE